MLGRGRDGRQNTGILHTADKSDIELTAEMNPAARTPTLSFKV